MKYSHNYTKLQKKRYTTIRRYSKAKKGDIITEVYPISKYRGGSHRAKVLAVRRNTLETLPIKLLQDDTDLTTRLEIYALFNEFYEKPIDVVHEKMYVYFLERVD